MNPLQQLLYDIRLEDTTQYLEIINHINTNKIESHHVSKYLRDLTQVEVNKLTPNQITLLLSLDYKGGYSVYMSNYNNSQSSPIDLSIQQHNIQRLYGTNPQSLSKEDLPYITDYMRTKWKQANPSATSTKQRGVGFIPKMDMFSLTIFRNNISKKFLRTEAKNLLLSVNKAFKESSKDMAAIKIRNKYYYSILENTEHLTKAALNTLMNTKIDISDYGEQPICYSPSEDEALVFNMYEAKLYMSFTPSECMDTYSTDTPIVTSNLGYTASRENQRLLGTISALTTLYTKTDNSSYLTLAARAAQHLPEDIKSDSLKATQSIVEMRKILQGSGNDSTNDES